MRPRRLFPRILPRMGRNALPQTGKNRIAGRRSGAMRFLGPLLRLDVDDAYRAAVTGLGGRRQLFLGNVPSHGDGDTVLQREYSGAGGGTQAAADAPFVDNGFHNASSFW